MNKKITIGIIAVAVILFSGWMILGVENKSKIENRMTEAKKSEKQDTAWENIQESCGYIPIAEQGEEIKQDDWSYRVNKVTWTKKQGEWPYPGECWYQCDEAGNVLEDMTLLVVNVTILRYQESENWEGDLYLNSYYTDLYDGMGKKYLVNMKQYLQQI